jgi:hypothetical protein
VHRCRQCLLAFLLLLEKRLQLFALMSDEVEQRQDQMLHAFRRQQQVV